MVSDRPFRERLAPLLRAWVDGLVYAVVVTVLVTLFALVVGIATGGGFVRGKITLFVVGWLLMTYSTVKMWPSRRSEFDLPSRNLFGLSMSDDDDDVDPDTKRERSPAKIRADSDTNRNQYGESLPEQHDQTRFQAFVRALPPNRWMQPPRPESRMTVPGKLFVASLLVFLVSILMEFVFGVGV